MSEMKDTVLSLIAGRGPLAAVEWLNKEPDAQIVATTYADVVNDLYWKANDLTAAIVIGLCGIQYCLGTPDLASIAKGISYNLGSFCWPGWDEPGIDIDPTALTVGRDAARLNLRLADELKKGDLPMSRAHWLVGTHALAAGTMDAAREEFDQSARYARAATSEIECLLAEGFGQLVSCLEKPDDKSARISLDVVRAKLNALDGGPEFVTQIDTAERVFRKTPLE